MHHQNLEDDDNLCRVCEIAQDSKRYRVSVLRKFASEGLLFFGLSVLTYSPCLLYNGKSITIFSSLSYMPV